MSERDIGILLGRVDSLAETIKSLDTHNSEQHKTMFIYINELKEKIGQVEIEQAGVKVYGEGLNETLTYIITEISGLKENTAKDISELRSVILVQLGQGFLKRLFDFQLDFLSKITDFVKTKAGAVISILIVIAIIACIFGLQGALQLIKELKH